MLKLLRESDKLEVNLVDLAELVGKCMANSLEALFIYLEEGESHKVKMLADTVHEYEARLIKKTRNNYQYIRWKANAEYKKRYFEFNRVN